MIKSKRREKILSNVKDRNVCLRCLRNINRVEETESNLLTTYKALCRSSKCFIHGKSLLPEKKCAKLKIKKENKLIKKEIERRRLLHIKALRGPGSDFGDVEHVLDDIDSEVFAKIEATVEDADMCDINVDLTGYGYLKDIIDRTIIWPLKKPDIFNGLRSAPKGVLLFGPPGTGKTSLGKSIAFNTNSTLFNISSSTLMSKWVGESEKLVRTMFLVAKARQPSIIFIDEVDSVLSQRTPEENGSTRRMKNEFLICMDGSATLLEDRIMVIGATNRPQELDDAARRRFSKRFYVPLPDRGARKEILNKLLKNECHSLDEVDINEIVKRTEGYSVADIKNLAHEAAMGPVKALSTNAIVSLKAQNLRPISLEDFLGALQLIKPTVSKEQVKFYENWDSMYGYSGTDSLRAS